jgi:hypothetical protein
VDDRYRHPGTVVFRPSTCRTDEPSATVADLADALGRHLAPDRAGLLVVVAERAFGSGEVVGNWIPCPDGRRVIGGGFDIDLGYGNARPHRQGPWRAVYERCAANIQPNSGTSARRRRQAGGLRVATPAESDTSRH